MNKALNDVAGSWTMLEQGPAYIVMVEDLDYIIEEPMEETGEAIVRVFTTWREADLYKDQAQKFFDVPLNTVATSLSGLYEMIEDIQTQSVEDYGCPAGIVLCQVEEDYIEAIDVIYSAYCSTPETSN